MPIPYYLANASPVMGLNEDDPEMQPEGPFDAPPPSVEEAKRTKPPVIDPFADDPNDPTLRRIKDIDAQLSGRQGSLGGIIAAFSPHGDRTMQNLMAQRHLYGQEYHGDQQLRRQLAASQMQQESAFRRADAQEKAAAERAKAQTGAAEIRGGAQVTTGAGHDAARMYGADQGLAGVQARVNRPFPVAAGASVYNPATATMGAQTNFRPQGVGSAPKPVADPLVQMQARQLDAAIKAYDKALTADATGDKPITGSTASDKFSNDNKRAILQQKRDDLAQQLANLYKQHPGVAAPSAAPSTAPSVHASESESDASAPTAVNPTTGEKIKWNGTAWVPAS